jgi:hypothetical protein
MNTWIANAGHFQQDVSFQPVFTTSTSFNLSMFFSFGAMFSPNTQVFVSSIQMYINAISPVIEFFDPSSTVIHAIRNTGRYTGIDLQTFDIPHVNMTTVVRVRITSASTIEPNITWYGLQGTNAASGVSTPMFTGNFTCDTVVQSLMIFDNANGVTGDVNVTIATTGETQITSGFIIQPNLEYNFHPFYLTIPTFSFTGSGTSTVTPVPFTLRLTQNGLVVTTVNFNLNAGASYPNGIIIPLTTSQVVDRSTSSVVPSSVTGTIVTPTNTITPPDYLRGTSTIAGTLICSLNGVANLRVVTSVNDNGGLAIRIFGTGVTIDPLFTPTSKDIRSPITFSPNKMITFPNILTATDRIASNTMSYAIIQPTPNIVTPQTTSNQENGGTQSFSLLSAFNQNNATIAVFAHSRGARGLHARSIFSQPSIFNYQNLLPGRVVPFVNTYNAEPRTIPILAGSSAFMNVTFTQNVVLNSLDFGYVFPVFILPTIGATNAGYAVNNLAVGATATFTITLTSIPRIAGEPSITYGRVQFVAIPRNTNYIAMSTNNSNSDGNNDGTLLSIPFTTTAMTTLPTSITSFTPSVAGSNFAFNIGDQVRIEFAFSQNGNYMVTPTSDQFLSIVQQPEMCGALMCTPNAVGNPTFNPTPINLWFSTNNGELSVLTDTVLTETFTFDAPAIIHGFRLTSFRLQGVTAVLRLRVTIFRNNNNVFQVYFIYDDSRLSGTPAPLFIPFSYAEFDRYQAIVTNANDVVRIVPTSIVFSRPQHPIFNTGDTFRMEISVTTATTGGVQSALSPQTIVHRGNTSTNTIAGRLSGIILSTPTISINNAPVTPVYTAFIGGTSTRRITIPTPMSNSNGTFVYTVSSEAVIPSAADGGVGASVVVDNNDIIANGSSSLQSRILIRAFQRSSTSFTSSSANFPAIDFIDTSQAEALSSGAVAIVEEDEAFAPFIACVPHTNATLGGFSFQFFGGYRVSSAQYTVTVWARRNNQPLGNSLTITFSTVDNGNTTNGTMIYIPFQPGAITTPTFVRNLTYAGSLPQVQLGDFVYVSAIGSNGGRLRGRQRRIPSQSPGDGSLMGSLLFSWVTGMANPDIITRTFAEGNLNNFGSQTSNLINVPARQQISLFDANIDNTSPLMLYEFGIPNFIFADLDTRPTFSNPFFLNFIITVSGNSTLVYRNTMTIAITGGSGTTIRIPFDMPMPSRQFSRDEHGPGGNGRGYYVHSLMPEFNPEFFEGFWDNSNTTTSTATFSFPRFARTPAAGSFYSYRVTVNSDRPFQINNDNNNFGSLVMSRLLYRQVM